MMKNYTDILQELREDKDLRQLDIANVLGCTRQNYAKIETSKSLLSIEQLVKLSNFYKLTVDYLLGISDKREPIIANKNFNYASMVERISNIRKENNYTQLFIAAEVLNITQSMYSRLENCIHSIDILSLMKLADLYKVSVSYLLGLED